MEVSVCQGVPRPNTGYRDTLQIHNKDRVEELMIDSNDQIQTMYIQQGDAARLRAKGRPQSTPHPMSRTKQTENTEADGRTMHALKLQDWLSDRHVKSVQEKADMEAKNTRRMYTAVLDTENTFVKNLADFLKEKETHTVRRREVLHKKWVDQVHEPIRHEINTQMDGPIYKELDLRKRMLYKEYLEHVNKKGHVFLDTYAPEEYYPMGIHPVRPSLITAQTKQLKDPLISQGRERAEEDRIIFRCMTGSKLPDQEIEKINLPPLPLVPLGRHGTSSNTWLAMPMGDIESPVRHSSRRRMNPSYNSNKFRFEDWGKPCGRSVVDDELQIQRKRMFSPDLTIAQVRENLEKMNTIEVCDHPTMAVPVSASA